MQVGRLTEIADEVFDLIGVTDVFGFLDETTGDMWKLDSRLQEVMRSIHSFSTIELAMYLRASASRSDSLPTWQPLLNSAYELGMTRSDQVDDIFYGLMPPPARPQRNTDRQD